MQEVIQKKEVELTDASLWKPIYAEIKRIQEKRELLKNTVQAVGVN